MVLRTLAVCPFEFSALASIPGSVSRQPWAAKESQVEGRKHQDDANIGYQPFQEAISEEHKICADYDSHHSHDVDYGGYLFSHCITNALF